MQDTALSSHGKVNQILKIKNIMMMKDRLLKAAIAMLVKIIRVHISDIYGSCGESTAATLLSIHNSKFLIDFAKKARQAILNDSFGDFYNEHYSKLI